MSAEFTPHTADELASMRATLEASLPDLCTVQQPNRTNTARGRTVTYSATASNVACRVGPFTARSENERLIAGKVQGVTPYVITLPYNTSIQNDYRIVVTGGDTYEVVDVLEHGAWTLGLRVVCKKVAQED